MLTSSFSGVPLLLDKLLDSNTGQIMEGPTCTFLSTKTPLSMPTMLTVPF